MYKKELQEMLEGFQEKFKETPHVYYQPPEGLKMSYPCFVYSYDSTETLYSNGIPYLFSDRYSVTYISKKAAPSIVKAMMLLPNIRYDRHFTSENLNHYSFLVSSKYYRVQDGEVVDLSDEGLKFLGGTNGYN